MAIIPFIGPSYETKSQDQHAERCVNWYVEQAAEGGKYPSMLFPTPGMLSFSAVAGADSVVRALYNLDGILYAVVDNKLYSLDSAGASTSRGTLNTSIGRVEIAAIEDQLLLLDGTNGYTYIPSSTTFATITDADFVDKATSVTAQDSFFITNDPGTGKFFISKLSDGTSWAALDFATAEGRTDDLVAVYSLNRELWLLGAKTTEVWFNSGATFPFERLQGIFIEQGCAAQATVQRYNNTLFWLSSGEHGDGTVIRADGFNVRPISTPAIDYQISTYGDISDAFAYTYQDEGHIFYVLTFPTADKTWVYDVTSGFWHERDSFVDQEFGRHRSNCYAFAFGKHFVGDFDSGSIFELDTETYTDGGTTIRRLRRSTHIDVENRNLVCYKLQIEFETGVGLTTGQGSDPQAMLRVSRDGGRTFGNELLRSPGKIGEYALRAIWHRLGVARTFTFELTATDPISWIVLGGIADIRIGSN